MSGKSITFTVPGVRGKARPRFARNGRIYTPSDTVKYEQAVAAAFREQCRYMPFDEGEPLRISIVAHYNRPSRATRIQREMMAKGFIRPTVKPDGDNVCKAVWDGLAGVAYPDDRQIVEGNISKVYCRDGVEPHIEVTVESLAAEGSEE